MTDTVLRPRSATEIVDAAVHLLRTHYKAFVIVSGIGMIPLLVMNPLVSRVVESGPESLGGTTIFSFFAMMIMSAMWYNLASAAVIAAASQAYLDGHIDVGAAIRRVAGRVPAVLYTSFLKGFAIGFGAILLLVGAVYYYATYFSLPTTVVIEDLTGKQGEARARMLVDGNRGRALKPLALVLIIYLCIVSAGDIIGNMILGADRLLAQNMLNTAITILVYPIIPITEMLVYYDLRIRNEGFDVEVMTSRLDASGATPSP